MWWCHHGKRRHVFDECACKCFCKYNSIGIASVDTCQNAESYRSIRTHSVCLLYAHSKNHSHFKWPCEIIIRNVFCFIKTSGICKLKRLSNDIIYKWPQMMIMTIKNSILIWCRQCIVIVCSVQTSWVTHLILQNIRTNNSKEWLHKMFSLRDIFENE